MEEHISLVTKHFGMWNDWLGGGIKVLASPGFACSKHQVDTCTNIVCIQIQLCTHKSGKQILKLNHTIEAKPQLSIFYSMSLLKYG